MFHLWGWQKNALYTFMFVRTVFETVENHALLATARETDTFKNHVWRTSHFLASIWHFSPFCWKKDFDLLKPLAIGVTGSLPLVGCWLAAELIARGPALVSSFDQSVCLHFFPWCIVNLILKEDDHRKVCLIFKIVVIVYIPSQSSNNVQHLEAWGSLDLESWVQCIAVSCDFCNVGPAR